MSTEINTPFTTSLGTSGGNLSDAELVDAIARLKKEKNAILMAHYYQEAAIQDIADYIGDSLGLAQEAAKTNASIIILAGVVFMAETAKILNPEKKVLVPDIRAGCSLADNCPGEDFRNFIAQYPGHCVITYVNSSVEVKALSDILCTSSNAEKIINSVPKDRPILFAPDQHLGAYLQRRTGREMVLWKGSCIVHVSFDEKQIVKFKARYPEAKVIAHPECPEQILRRADHIGSTSSLLSYVKTSTDKRFIVVTESGIIHQMQKACPDKEFIPAPTDKGCLCNECPYMRLNSLEKLFLCLQNEKPEIIVEEKLRIAALRPLERMLELS